MWNKDTLLNYRTVVHKAGRSSLQLNSTAVMILQGTLTLAIFLHLLEKCKFLGVVHHHKFLQKSLDHFTHSGGAADMQLLDGIQWQIEGCPLLCHVGQVDLLEGIMDGLWPKRSWDCHRPAQFQVHFNEACVSAVIILGEQQEEKWTWRLNRDKGGLLAFVLFAVIFKIQNSGINSRKNCSLKATTAVSFSYVYHSHLVIPVAPSNLTPRSNL